MIVTKIREWSFPSKEDSLNVSYDVLYNEITQIDNDVGLSLKYIFGSQINYFAEKISDLDDLISQAKAGELALVLEDRNLYKFDSSRVWLPQVSFGALNLIYDKDPIYANYQYSLGQTWINTSNGKVWYIVDNTDYDAIWISNLGEISAKNIFKANIYLDKPLKDFFIDGKLKYRILADIYLKDLDIFRLYSGDKKIYFGQIKADKNKCDYFLSKDIIDINSSDDEAINEDFKEKYVCVVKALLRLNTCEIEKIIEYYNENYSWIYINVSEIVKDNDKLKAFEKLLYDMNSIYNITDYMMDYNININELKFKDLTFREDKFLNFEITDKLIFNNYQFFLLFICKDSYIYGPLDEQFGSSVAVDDNYIYVGSSEWENSDGNQVGKLTIFSKFEYNKIKTLYGTLNEHLTDSIYVDKDFIYIGGNNNIKIINKLDYSIVKKLYGTQNEEQFGSSVTVDDKYIYVGSKTWVDTTDNKNIEFGKLTIYKKTDYSIVKELYGTQYGEQFGSSVTTDDNYIYVGSPEYDSEDLNGNGKLTIFNKTNYTIIKELYGTKSYTHFSFSVAVDDNYFYVGTDEWTDEKDFEIGKLTIFNKVDYTVVKELYGSQNGGMFGYSVAVDESRIYVGIDTFTTENGIFNKIEILCKNEIFEG